MTAGAAASATTPDSKGRAAGARPSDPDRRAEFEALFESILPRAYSAARYMTGDAAEAEDLVQDAALLAWRGFDGFESGTNFRAWFLRILTNHNYTRVRRAGRRPQTASLEDVPDLYLYRKTGAGAGGLAAADPAGALIEALDVEEVRRAIGELPEEFRTVAALYFSEDLSYREIADAVDIPVGTVRSRLHRGRKLLQVALWRLAGEHGLVPAGEVP